MADIKKLANQPKWTELTTGMAIDEGGSSKLFHTGEWTSAKPEVDPNLCRQCLLCAQYCPDSAIPVKGDERVAVDVLHCKGCGICVNVCPFDAITMKGVD